MSEKSDQLAKEMGKVGGTAIAAAAKVIFKVIVPKKKSS